MRKQERKTGDLINEKPLNSIRKRRGKPMGCCFAGVEKAPKPSYTNGGGNPGAD